MDRLSPETRTLLERARDGDRLDGEHREALRRGVASALGVATPGTPRGTISSPWPLRALGALGATGAALVVVARIHGVAVLPSATPQVAPRVLVAGAPPSSAPGESSVIDRVAPSPTPSASPTNVLREPARAGPPRSLGPRSERHPAPEGDALAAEVRLVAAAQSALDVGDGAHALALLDEHERRFPAGVLAPESAALRVDALCAVGRAGDARAEALRLRASHPSSPVRRFPASCTDGAE